MPKKKNALDIMPAVKDDLDWRARDDMQTLRRAKEIESDRRRLKAAQKCADEEIKTLQRVKGGQK